MNTPTRKTLELALAALRNSEPIMKHYPEPVKRHDDAIAAIQRLLQLADIGRTRRAKAKKVVLAARCNQCEALMINGVFCHETGCPNTKARYDSESGEWIKTRKCFECGCTVDADDLCCAAQIEEETW